MDKLLRRLAVMLVAGVVANIIAYIVSHWGLAYNMLTVIGVFSINFLSSFVVGQLVALMHDYGFSEKTLALTTILIATLIVVSTIVKAPFVAGLPASAAIAAITLPHTPIELTGACTLAYGLGVRRGYLAFLGALFLFVAAIVEIFVSVDIIIANYTDVLIS